MLRDSAVYSFEEECLKVKNFPFCLKLQLVQKVFFTIGWTLSLWGGKRKAYPCLLLCKESPYLLLTSGKSLWKTAITHKALKLNYKNLKNSPKWDSLSTGNRKEIIMFLVHKIQHTCLILRKSHLLKIFNKTSKPPIISEIHIRFKHWYAIKRKS